jgi:hypothetical protein
VPLIKTLVPGGPVLGPTASTAGVGVAVYVKWSDALGELLPDGVVTMTSTVPVADTVGLKAWSTLSARKKAPFDATLPNWTNVALPRLLPLMNTPVPPSVGPLAGLIAVTTGAVVIV